MGRLMISKRRRLNENLDREDDKKEDYQENFAVQLAEQEEDDLERIKEASRRRRQAIFEKYKNKQQKPLTTLLVGDAVGDSPAKVESAEAVREKSDNQWKGQMIMFLSPLLLWGNRLHKMVFRLLRCPLELGECIPKGKGDGIAVEKSGLHDNWDDAKGYNGYRFGEVLDGRYEIIAAHGNFRPLSEQKILRPSLVTLKK